jgi:hypothetical protein
MIQINKRSIHGSSFTVRQVRWPEMGEMRIRTRLCVLRFDLHLTAQSTIFWMLARPPTTTRILHLWERSPALDSQLVPFVDHHRTQTLTIELGLSWFYPCCYFEKWFMVNKRCWVYECTWMRGMVGICDSFLTRILCLCRCPLLCATGGV